jgi:hypothetical protein
MTPLHELQAAFRADILRDEANVAALVLGDGLAPAARLQIYRNNSFITLTEALKATFPVVCRLVDERFFSFAAHAFIRAHPPAAPCLAEYGAGFADFLAAFPPAASLAYLPDVARFEWALNAAYHAPDAPPLAPGRIVAVPTERQAALRFVLHPAVQLFESRFPISRIWESNQGGAESEAIDLDSGGCRLLIYRAGIEVHYLSPDKGSFAFLSALAGGSTFEGGYTAAAEAEPRFDLAAALGDCLRRQLFIDVA